ncbi:MAG TPA: STAS domain-containing protein [Pyrinomonadaceae bacterium]|jgi:anti-sigma B factor antagonist|nr:STAS domain-containing protein [Pyrinomonadaceae bacterium]
MDICKIKERRFGAVTVLDLDGELRRGESRAVLRDAIARLSEEGRNQIILNLAGLSAIDASGLGELLQSHVELKQDGGQLKLLYPARALREMMSITKLDNVFDTFESESEAVAAFRKGEAGGQMAREVGSYDEDNAETARFEGDDVGLPENPIYSNFSQYLWRTHARHGLVQSPNRSDENTCGHRPTRDE